MSYPLPGTPCYRSMLGIDIEGSTRRMDPDKGYLRSRMYAVLDEALDIGGIAGSYRDPPMDRGDGALTLIHPVDEAPKTALLATVIPAIATLLAEHNTRHPEHAFRVRTVVHAGEVTYDEKGCYGEALDVAFRLLEAEAVKKMLIGTTAPMVLVVSDEIHKCVVRHRYKGIDPNAFTRLTARRVSGLSRAGWVRPVEASPVMAQLEGGQIKRMDDYRRGA